MLEKYNYRLYHYHYVNYHQHIIKYCLIFNIMSFKLVLKLRTKTGIKLGTKQVIYQKLNYAEKGYPCQQSWN